MTPILYNKVRYELLTIGQAFAQTGDDQQRLSQDFTAIERKGHPDGAEGCLVEMLRLVAARQEEWSSLTPSE